MANQVGSKNRPVKTTATGNAKDTGTPVSIPPSRPPIFDKDFTFGRQSYGSNAYSGASSDNPGDRTRSDLSVNNDDTDPVLGALRQHGSAAMRAPEVGDDVEDVKGTPATQLRNITANPAVPTTFGMRNRSGEGAKVPSTTGRDPSKG
jgi:hypothetical protein